MSETGGHPLLSEEDDDVVATHMLGMVPTREGKNMLVKLEFHEDGAVTFKGTVFGRHA